MLELCSDVSPLFYGLTPYRTVALDYSLIWFYFRAVRGV